MNIASVDINLLKVFHALYQQRNVTRAGASIGLAQSSMSNALSRLRYLLKDRLFIRTPEGMLPTEHANRLAPKVAAALAMVEDIVRPADRFDPATAVAEVVLETSDNIAMQLGPLWAAHLQQNAPNFDLRLRSLNKDTAFDHLDDGSADVLLGTFAEIPSRFYQLEVMRDEFVCISRKQHPSLQSGLTLEHFAEIPQVMMTLRADAGGAMDSILRKKGLKRRVALTVAGFIAIPDIVAKTDYIALIPKSVANGLAERCGCDVFSVPVSVSPWSITMVWSQSFDSNAAKKYAVSELGRICNQFEKSL